MNIAYYDPAGIKGANGGIAPSVDSVKDAFGRVQAGWNVQHKPDGTHGAITVDSVTAAENSDTGATGEVSGVEGHFSGDVTAAEATVPTRIGLVGSSTAADGALGSGIDLDSEWDIVVSQDGSGNPRVSVIDLVNGVTPFMIRRFAGAYYIQAGPTSRAGGMVGNLGNPLDSFKSGYFDGVYALGFFRNSSTVAEGDGQNEPFAAGNFTASTGNWTLSAPDQVQLRYSLVGKRMRISFVLDTTSVSATPAQLRLTIPGGFTAAEDVYSTVYGNDNGAGWVNNVNAFTQAGLTFIAFQPGVFGVGTWAAAANTTAIRGVFELEVA